MQIFSDKNLTILVQEGTGPKILRCRLTVVRVQLRPCEYPNGSSKQRFISHIGYSAGSLIPQNESITIPSLCHRCSANLVGMFFVRFCRLHKRCDYCTVPKGRKCCWNHLELLRAATSSSPMRPNLAISSEFVANHPESIFSVKNV